jgi:predicted RND superfamily exporter protein
MFNRFIALVLRAPALVLIIVAALTVFFATQLGKLHWETDARVYMPKGHPAIKYDEKVEHIFGAKDAVILAIVNEKDGIFNPQTLSRIQRVTQQVAALPGVVANRIIDVASLSTASVFEGTDEAIGTRRLMPTVPTQAADIKRLKDDVYANAELFVGNIVSADGTAAMIRAKLKEGIANRYETYFRIKAIIAAETGDWSNARGGGQGDWQKWQKGADAGDKAQGAAPGGEPAAGQPQGGEGGWSADTGATSSGANAPAPGSTSAGGGQWPAAGGSWPQTGAAGAAGGQAAASTDDKFYLAGRPVIEVTSGMELLNDLKVMVPMLLLVTALVLFAVFRTWRGVLLPLSLMVISVIWTMGAMAALNVPLYTISTMLPVILVAVGIGDGIHVLSHYYDLVLPDPQRDSRSIVSEVMASLGAPLVVTSLTTAIGFLTLWFAEMPPFKIFGLFTVLGIAVCWLLSVTFIPAMLVLMKPKVGSYLQKRQSLRVRDEESGLVHALVRVAAWLDGRRALVGIAVAVLAVAATAGATRLFVDSSWLSDFRQDSELAVANRVINQQFSGTITLHAVVDAKKDGALKSLAVLKGIEDLQKHAESLPYVGDSLSVVDYLRSMNKTLHASDAAFDVLPATDEQVAEYLFLFSISGRPEELDEVVDFNYRQANVTIRIKTDHTQALRHIIDDLRQFADQRFAGEDVEVNFAGSANNSYLWADLLIHSQTTSIVFSKVAIAILAIVLFRSLAMGLLVVVPVTLSTLLIGGFAGAFAIPLDVSTALAAGVAIGVGVDYAVHFLFRYRRERQSTDDHATATRETMRSVGKSIVFNAVVVTAGFAVLLFSVFPPHVKLGEFVAAYMVLSCAAAFIVLPLLLRYVHRTVDAEP